MHGNAATSITGNIFMKLIYNSTFQKINSVIWQYYEFHGIHKFVYITIKIEED